MKKRLVGGAVEGLVAGSTSSVIPSGCHLPLEGEGCGGAARLACVIAVGAACGRPSSSLLAQETELAADSRPRNALVQIRLIEGADIKRAGATVFASAVFAAAPNTEYPLTA